MHSAPSRVHFSITPSRRNGPDRTTLAAWWGTFCFSFFFLLVMKMLVSNTEYGNERGEIDMQHSEVVKAESDDVTWILAIEFRRAVKDSFRNLFLYYCYCLNYYYYYYY